MVKVIDAEPQVVSAVDQEPKENVGPKDQTLDPALMSLRELQTVFRKRVMRAGKKNLAIRLTQTAFSFLGSKDSQIESVVREALRNVLIEYEIKRKKIGGSSIIEPFKIFPARRLSLAIRWIIHAAKMRINSATERSFSSKLAAELLAASKRSGKAFARAQEINKLVEKNIDYLKRRERRERSEGTSQFQKQ